MSTEKRFESNPAGEFTRLPTSVETTPSVSSSPWTVRQAEALEASEVFKIGAGVARDLVVFNNNAASRYVQVFDASALPSNGAVPILSVLCPAGDSVGFDWGADGMAFSTGFIACLSTTGATKTIAAADGLFTARYS